MSTTVSEPAAPTNNVIVRSRVPGEPLSGIKRDTKPALRPTNTRGHYVKWHPGCLSGKCEPNQHSKVINQPFTTKVPKRTWRPVLSRMAQKKRKKRLLEDDDSEQQQQQQQQEEEDKPHATVLVQKFPWLTMDVLVGSSVGVLVIALLITVILKLM